MSGTKAVRRLYVLILLIAVAAVVMRNDREVSEVYSRSLVEAVGSRWPPLVRSIVGPTLRLGSNLNAALIVMTVGLGFVVLREPFIPAGRRWPGRGVAAISVAGLAVVYGMIRVALDAMADPTSVYFGLSNPHFFSYAIHSGEGYSKNAVLGAWSLLILAGRWKSEADGLERLGRLLGWCWLTSIAFEFFQSALW
jgi:hypothetical protein